jgi:hypothetical protein
MQALNVRSNRGDEVAPLDAIQAIYLFVICLLLIRPHQKAGQRAAPIPSSQPAAKRNGQRSPLTIARA